MQGTVEVRRPIAARHSRWARLTARTLATMGVRPNYVSLASVAWAALAGAFLLAGGAGPGAWRAAALLLAALCIQLRLLCNMLDGLLAVEEGMQTPSGVVFNELPDRFSDAIILVCAGYAAAPLPWARELGWAAALLALLTAYVRALGGTVGVTQQFGGPMAKQQRMMLLTAPCILAAPLATTEWRAGILAGALVLIAAGSAITIARRTLAVIRELEAAP